MCVESGAKEEVRVSSMAGDMMMSCTHAHIMQEEAQYSFISGGLIQTQPTDQGGTMSPYHTIGVQWSWYYGCYL